MVNGPSLTYTSPLTGGEVGVSYSSQLTKSDGTTPYTWSVSSGALPAGLTLGSSTGLLSGTPTVSAAATFTVTVTDRWSQSASMSTSLTVIAAPSMTFAAPVSGVVGTAYSTTFSSTGGSGSDVWSVSAGSPPAGLTLNPSTGVLAGTPTAAGTTNFTVKVTDVNGGFATGAVSLSIKTTTTVSLSSSAATVTFGTSVTLTATVTPSDATGTVTFTDVPGSGPDNGNTVTLGTGTISGGVATVTVPLPAFGANPVTARYGGDGTHLAATSSPSSVEVAAYAGEIIVTEFRSSGPGGAEDSYTELYNTGAPAPLGGFTVASSSGGTVTMSDNTAILETNRSYLLTGRFSLDAVATPDEPLADLGSGGIRVVAPDTAGTQTDAVGPTTGYHRGTGLAALTGTPTEQYGWVRLTAAGRPVDTGSNADDFRLVSTTGGLVGDVQSTLGSPAPTGSANPYQHNSTLQSTLLDPGVGQAVSPNRSYTRGTAGSPGLLVIRRTITNTSAAPVDTVRIRVTAISEANGAPRPGVVPTGSPLPTAQLRVINPGTDTSSIPVSGGGSVTVRNLSVDTPVTGETGGGLNSTLTVPLPGDILADGDSVSIAITLAVDAPGTFWLGYNVDALVADA